MKTESLRLFVISKPGTEYPSRHEKNKREEVMKELYRDLLKNQIPPLIKKWEQKLDVTIDDWGVRR